MGIPQIIIIIFYTITFTGHLIKHGQPQPKYNVWSTLLGLIINGVILYWGGFWN